MKQFCDDETAHFTQESSAQVILLPVPYDGTSTWLKGADKGPFALLDVAENMEFYDSETDSMVIKRGIHTTSPIDALHSPEAMVEAVEKVATTWIDKGKFVVTLGGEHSVSIGSILAHAKAYPNITILQIDAHSDLKDVYHGSKFNHASVMARAREVAPIIQVGLRSVSLEEKNSADLSRIFWAKDVHRMPNWIDKACEMLTENVYITIDLDAFDPAYVPGTGTPEPGGLSWFQAVDLIWAVSRKAKIVGFDIVELLPRESDQISEFFAARLLYQTLSIALEGHKQ